MTAEEYKKKLITENKSLIPNEVLYLSPIKQAYKDGYEQGQESMLFEFAIEDRGKLLQKIEELKAQIEKMKCCENCNHHKKNEIIRIGNDVLCGKNKPCEKWELAE